MLWSIRLCKGRLRRFPTLPRGSLHVWRSDSSPSRCSSFPLRLSASPLRQAALPYRYHNRNQFRSLVLHQNGFQGTGASRHAPSSGQSSDAGHPIRLRDPVSRFQAIHPSPTDGWSRPIPRWIFRPKLFWLGCCWCFLLLLPLLRRIRILLRRRLEKWFWFLTCWFLQLIKFCTCLNVKKGNKKSPSPACAGNGTCLRGSTQIQRVRQPSA